jgi:hypothetical protein
VPPRLRADLSLYLAALAQAAGVAATLVTAAALLAGTGALVGRSRAR